MNNDTVWETQCRTIFRRYHSGCLKLERGGNEITERCPFGFVTFPKDRKPLNIAIRLEIWQRLEAVDVTWLKRSVNYPKKGHSVHKLGHEKFFKPMLVSQNANPRGKETEYKNRRPPQHCAD